MSVVIPPPRRNLFAGLLKPLLVVLPVTAVIVFLFYRFGDTPVEKAEKLFQRRALSDLRSYTAKRLEKGDVNPLFYSYFAVAEFSSNPQSKLGSLLGNIQAVDDRPIFRRETIVRILQVAENQARTGEVLTEVLKLENPLSEELKAIIAGMVKSPASLTGNAQNFAALTTLFPESIRRVSARQLQFRSAPSTDAEVLRRLADGETLLVRSSGAQTTASGKAGRWVFALDRDMASGWVFDAYLKKLPD